MTDPRGQPVAVITGAASGIGSGLARRALTRGMAVVLADIDAAALDAFATTLDGAVRAVPTDVTDEASVDRLAEAAFDAFGRVDLLFNNAGVLRGYSWEIDRAWWDRVFAVNVTRIVNGVRSFIPRMIARDLPGRVVNTASVGGIQAGPTISPYTAGKAAVVALTDALDVELQLAGTRLRASVLAPGAVKTGIWRDALNTDSTSESAASVGRMKEYVEADGIAPDELAARAFEQIDAGRFWILTQAEDVREMVRARRADRHAA